MLCGKCGTSSSESAARFAVCVGDRWIASFTYGHGMPIDKVWSASDGILIAARCKAIEGDVPYLWERDDSAAFVAERANGQPVEISPRTRRTRRAPSSPGSDQNTHFTREACPGTIWGRGHRRPRHARSPPAWLEALHATEPAPGRPSAPHAC